MTRKHSFNLTELVSDFNRLHILTMLYQGPTHGYQIINQYKHNFKKELSPSAVYPFLHQLEEKHYIKRTTTVNESKLRNTFELTPTGQALCRNLFRYFTEIHATAFKIMLQTCTHCNSQIYKGAHHETINGTKQPFCCIHCASTYKQTVHTQQQQTTTIQHTPSTSPDAFVDAKL
ncbi:MAG: PadR family transcriptional regulator [Nitrososphaerota archaeon]|jgi:DNA-binding PadR family transcriptional regulator|nr:PadR family transcriptional regulator [Nitrososphaerota archaeon]